MSTGQAAAAEACAQTTSTATPAGPTAGSPCWVDVTPYPFGSDGSVVDPSSAACIGSTSGASGEYGPEAYGASWQGDYAPGVNGQPPCYEQVTSMAFRAPNRGLAATQIVGGNSIGGNPVDNPYGVWLYSGTSWFPDPTFPGSSSCPGSTILWAGKLDYWLIGGSSPGTGSTTLCHFDGVNLDWEVLSLPAAAVDQLPLFVSGTSVSRVGGVTSGTCLAYDNCWFFGTDGITVHWDGQELTDLNDDLGASPWLDGSFTSAASAVSPSGEEFGLAVDSGLSENSANQIEPVPAAPDGTAGPLAYTFSSGAGWSPLAFTPPAATGGAVTQPVVAAVNANGDEWVANYPGYPVNTNDVEPAPLLKLNSDGSDASCPGPDAFTYSAAPEGYDWTSLAVSSDGSAFAGASYRNPAITFGSSATTDQEAADREPVIVHATCGTAPTVANGGITEFRIPDPTVNDQATAPLVPADWSASTSAIAVPATNDAWAAAGGGILFDKSNETNLPQRPHLYQYTDGQPPNAPAGNDDEDRPSLFTLSPPEYIVSSPTVVVQSVTTTVTKKKKARKVKLPPAVYAIQTKLSHVTGSSYELSLHFKVRRTVTIGLAALRGHRIVARTALKRFKPGSGQLTVPVNRSAWPTGLKLLS